MARNLLLSLLLLAGPAAAKSRIVVLGISASSEALRPVAESINEQVLTDLGREERLDVLGTSDVQAVLGLERQKQLLGCSDSSDCLVEISGALGAPWLVSGSLAKLGKAMRIDLKLIRTRDGKVVFRDGRTFKDESDVFEAVSALVSKLVKAIDFKEGAGNVAPGPTPEPVKVTPTPVEPKPTAELPPPPAPQAVEKSAAPSSSLGKWVLGGAGLAAALTGGALVGIGFAVYEATRSRRAELDYAVAQSNYGAANGLKVTGVVVGAAGIAALGAALVWFLLPTDAANVAFGVSSNGLQVRGSF